MEALRGLGYSTAAALADIVDNSISAGASEVCIDFAWADGASRVSVLDNGRGMDDPELEKALRLGDKSPLDERAPEDLGRFGMGLKTASFSQCRRLTAASVKEGCSPCCLRWDLDALAARPDDGWLLFEGPAEGSEAFLEPLSGRSAGTLILWEKLDRIVTEGSSADDFCRPHRRGRSASGDGVPPSASRAVSSVATAAQWAPDQFMGSIYVGASGQAVGDARSETVFRLGICRGGMPRSAPPRSAFAG